MLRKMCIRDSYKDAPAYINGVSEAIFKIGMCLPAGPWVTDEDVYYIVAVSYTHLDVYKRQIKYSTCL